MKMNIWLYFLCVIIFISQINCNKLPENIGSYGETIKDLSCRLDSDKKLYRIGDKITFTLLFNNESNRHIVLCYREGFFVSDMLSFKNADGTSVQKTIFAMFKLVPLDRDNFQIIPARKTLSVKVTGQIQRQNPSDTYVNMEFFHQTFLLPQPGKFYATFQYKMPMDTPLALKNSELWTGAVTSGVLGIEIGERK